MVLRELLHAFEVGVPRQSAWEYLLLEQVHKQPGLDKLFGMNVLVEGIALSIFGMMAGLPGLDVLHLSHLDEARHTALPVNYFAEFPMSRWQRLSPFARLNRVRLVLPAVGLIFHMEQPLSVLGIDALSFGGSILRKVTQLSVRAGFLSEADIAVFVSVLNRILNLYASATRRDHTFTEYGEANTTNTERALAVEAEIFAA